MITFGPQLIGQTEKALGAVLGLALAEVDLTEPEWVALRLTEQFDNTGTLAESIRNKAHFPDAQALLSGLVERGLVADDRLTTKGNTEVTTIKGQIAELVAPLWASLDPDDTAATERTLNIVLQRAQAVLARSIE